MKHDNPDDFAIVLFDHLSAGESIFATDAAFQGGCAETCASATDGLCDDGGPGSELTTCAFGSDCTDCGSRALAFATGETHLTYTATAEVPAGTVLTYSNFSGAALSLESGGDEILIYRGSRAAPQFLCGFCNRPASCGFESIPGASGMFAGVFNFLHTATSYGMYDQWIYDTRATGLHAPTTGSRQVLLAAISDSSNWFKSNTLFIPMQDVIPTGGYLITNLPPSMPPPPPPPPSLHSSPPSRPPPPPLLPPPPFDSFPSFTYAFNGENSSYTGGCQSTWIRSDTPDYVGAQDTGVTWDGSSTVGHYDSVLVQFPDIIGLGPNQLRPHEYIQRATLRYNVDETFWVNARGATAQLHEISKPWDANSTTFRTFVGTQGLNEDEYRTPAIATALANRSGWFELDVTASVRSWVNHVNTNNGWIWMPSPQSLGGSGDGSSMRACSAPPDRRVNLVVLAAQQPPRPPSPPARPPPPPTRPSPPPPPPRAPFTVMTIRNAQHARLRMVAPTTNYATATEVFWDGNSACAPAAHKPLSLPSWSARLHQQPLPAASSASVRASASHLCVPLLP